MLPRHDTAETGTAAATVVGSYARTVRSATTEALLHHDEPAIRWKTRVRVLGEDPGSRPLRRLQKEIRRSSRVRGCSRATRRSRPAPTPSGRARTGCWPRSRTSATPVSYTHLRAHETRHDLVCRL